MRKSSLEERSRELLPFFNNECNIKNTFCKVQRIIWERTIFPHRFKNRFLCSHCQKKAQNLGVCLSCGCIYCKDDIFDHECRIKFGVDISTHQLFIYENKQRQFLFHPKIDHLVIAAKFSVLDNLPLTLELSTSLPILPFPRDPLPIHPYRDFKSIASVLQCMLNDQVFAKYFLSYSVSSKNCTTTQQALYLCLSKIFQNYMNGIQIPFLEFLAVVTNLQNFTEEKCYEPDKFYDLIIKNLKKSTNLINIMDLIGIKIGEHFRCAACTSIDDSTDDLIVLKAEFQPILNIITSGSKSKKVCPKCRAPMEEGNVQCIDFPPTFVVSSPNEIIQPLSIRIESVNKDYVVKSFVAREDNKYYSVVQKFGKWFKINEKVQEIPLEDVQSIHPILYFYSQKYNL